MIEIISHFRWEHDESYGSRRHKYKGTIIFWLGVTLFQTTYHVYSKSITFGTHLIVRDGGSLYDRINITEIGMPKGEDQMPSEYEVERWIADNLAPLMVMALDGRDPIGGNHAKR